MRGTAQNWSSGSLALALSNLARPSVVGGGLPNLSLSQHAPLPSLLPSLDKLDALQHLSQMLTLLQGLHLAPLSYGAYRLRISIRQC